MVSFRWSLGPKFPMGVVHMLMVVQWCWIVCLRAQGEGRPLSGLVCFQQGR